MEFVRRAQAPPETLAVLAGTFHPPTRAHLALAKAALAYVDEVLFVLPKALPHKSYGEVSHADRLRILEAAIRAEPRFSLAVTRGGLFIDIARECREAYAAEVELLFLCGRDAAERILNWDYGEPGAVASMLAEFGLLVADREGRYAPPAPYAHRILRLALPEDFSGVSGSHVRKRMKQGQSWEHLVPSAALPLIRSIYLPRQD